MAALGKPLEDFPVPKSVEGGCLCGALRYRVDFPEGHDFRAGSCTCQCTQCRKQTSSLFWVSHIVRPVSAFKWTSDTKTLKLYSASPDAERAFCGECSSVITWRPRSGTDSDRVGFAVGTVDPLYLFGEGADGAEVPKEGYGYALASGEGSHEWCCNEIKGVTDQIPWMGFTRGQRVETD